MQKAARQRDILTLLKERQCSNVRDICREIYASPATVRRDLREMEQAGLLRTFHGGVMLVDDRGKEVPMLVREQEGKDAKRRIACAAAARHDPPRPAELFSVPFRKGGQTDALYRRAGGGTGGRVVRRGFVRHTGRSGNPDLRTRWLKESSSYKNRSQAFRPGAVVRYCIRLYSI